MIADGHPPAAAPTDGKPLSQGRAFSSRAAGPLGGASLGVAKQLGLVRFEGLPGNVTRMSVADQSGPAVAWLELADGPAARARPPAVATEDERPGVAGVMQGAQHGRVTEGRPPQLAFGRPRADPHREVERLGGKMLDHSPRSTPCGRRWQTGG